MMTDDANRLLFAQEHDEANALKWWQEAPQEAKFAIWKKIQEKAPSQIDEVILRFAQLGFTHVALLDAQDNRRSKP